ncbi:phosphorylase family protein, partial [Natrialba asiatica]
KSDAATTVTALLAAPALELDSAYVVSAGIAGGPPERVALGSVVIADSVVDWDRKHRWDRTQTGASDGGDAHGDVGAAVDTDPAAGLDLLAYRPRDYVHRLDTELVDAALEAAADATLDSDPAARAYQDEYEFSDAPIAGPTVERGTTVCGDEFWHGPRYAREVAWLCEAYGVAPYLTTQMEDAATATALDRFGLLDRYLSVRAVANYDRPAPGETVEESFDGNAASLDLARENAARVGRTVVTELVASDPLGVGTDSLKT